MTSVALMKRCLTGLLALAIVVSAGSANAQTVILVRHAEKVDASADPALSEAGVLRALALSQVLADAGVTQVLTTPLIRTRETGRPTAEAAGLALTEVSLDGGGTAHAARVAEVVRMASPQDVILVVGHSNTVPAIAAALGDPSPETLRDCDYDRLVILTLNPGTTRIVRGRYGVPGPAC